VSRIAISALVVSLGEQRICGTGELCILITGALQARDRCALLACFRSSSKAALDLPARSFCESVAGRRTTHGL
jgi:hypothetical protein